MDASIAPRETLADVLGARARRTPADRLVVDIAGGLLIGAAAIWAQPPGWFALLCAALTFASYGAWALTEQRIHAGSGDPDEDIGMLWGTLRGFSTVIGLTTFVLLLFALLGVALGPMVS